MEYAIGCLFLVVALFVMTMNWLCVLAAIWNHKNGVDKNHSQVLLVPEFLIGIAALFPLPFAKWYLFIPLVLHVGTWVLPKSLFYLFRQILQSRKNNEKNI